MQETKETKTNTEVSEGAAKAAPKFAPRTTRRRPGNSGGPNAGRRGAPRRRGPRPKPEFDQKIINIRRVTRVMAGGRRFSFSVAMLIGDKKGRVGFGLGKSSDTSLAINKAVQDAKKNMVSISRTKDMSIPHEVEAKFKASRVWLTPNKDKGLVAGASIRDIFNLAGMTNITTKIFSRSKNPINTVRATMAALAKLPEMKETKVKVEKKTEAKQDDKK
jgi:small subunit ribosomal protein S5